MGDKRKLENPADAVVPEGKKMKKEKKEKKEKKDKKEKKEEVAPVEESTPEVKEKKEKKDKKEKKEKKDKSDKKEKKEKKEKRKAEEVKSDEETESPADKMDVDEETTEKKEKKDKKEKKEKKDKKNKKQKVDEETATPQEQEQEQEQAANGETEGKNSRFICFVGNLPYSANHESLTKHFEKNPPATIRVATKKEAPTKCRGFAFIEFDNYDRMKTCLKLYHHSNFDDGKYPPRRINVELTAGGGGNTDSRKAKIQAKNEKLNDERQRDAKKINKDKKKHDKPARNGAGTGANAAMPEETPTANADDDKYAGVHPSRRPRMW